MKKYLLKTVACICSLLLLLCAASCGSKPAESGGSASLSVVATIFPPFDFAREVAGEYAQVSMLLPPGTESHAFEPTPQDIIKVQNCDVFIYGGGHSDAWVDKILGSFDSSGIQIVRMMDCVETVEEEIVSGMQEEAEEDHDSEKEYDEHVWTSPTNAEKIVGAISAALEKADPENKNSYRENAKSYQVALAALDQSFQDVVNSSSKKTMVFGDRFPFRYFADAYGLSYSAAFPGCSSETEPSIFMLTFLIDQVKAEQIPVVFHIEFSNEKIADTICEETGAKKLLFHSCHNVSQQEMDAGASYISLMEQNVINLREALL